MNASQIPVIAIVGPTAVGKSDYAIRICDELVKRNQTPAVINADAFQLYKEMDIGTAKPSIKERHGIPHFQIDVLDVSETATVAVYQRKARKDLENALCRNMIPVIAGGSGLYVRSLLDEMNFAPTDKTVREELYNELDDVGVETMYEKLRSIDPKAAENIEPNNSRRILRALEVIKITNGKYSAYLPRNEYHYENVFQFGLTEELPVLDDRINKRAENMMRTGLKDEFLLLKDRLGITAKKAIGYKEFFDFTAEGKNINDTNVQRDIEEAIALHTRQLVRKQISWFKRDKRIDWIKNSITNPPNVEYAIDKLSL